MEAVRPNSLLVKQAVDYLLSKRTFYGYSPYKAKGPVVAALAVYFKQTQFEKNDYRLKISVNGNQVKSATVRDEQPTMLIDVPADNLVNDQNKEKYYDAAKIVVYFEILRERYPELYIPFDKILTVGRAYRDIEEFERAYLVYKATIDASFVNDSNVSAVLQDEGQFMSSIDFMENLWRKYPDTPQITAAYFALSQALYSKADEAEQLAKAEGFGWESRGFSERKRATRNVLEKTGKNVADKPQKKITKRDILKETVVMLSQFLTLYPEDTLADDATFSMANTFLDLEDFPTTVSLCQSGIKRYPKSEYLSSFQYVEALGLFSQRKYDEAVKAAVTVADGKSKDRDLARYIIGQIYHAQGKPNLAIEWYGKVKDEYPDAQESISYFEEKRRKPYKYRGDFPFNNQKRLFPVVGAVGCLLSEAEGSRQAGLRTCRIHACRASESLKKVTIGFLK
ncbi:tetratricopeptide repeat protein [bacterium]|nr:tetratricopeptide repeat protein [bacterium]